METKKRIIKEYVTKEGKNLYRDWFDSLKNVRTQVKIDVRLIRVRLGNFGDAQSVGKGVYELRFHFGPGYRIYYGLDGNEIVLLLCAGNKSSQKKDIKKAHIYWEEHIGGK